MKKVTGQVIDIQNHRIYPGEITMAHGKIISIREKKHKENTYLLPGFIDAHIHIESSMLIPSEFARMAVLHGTVATVSDPHEIANVLGIPGVEFMINNGRKTPFKFHFGAPSCVPATSFETAGACIDAEDIRKLMALPDIHYLAEVMDYPAVLSGQDEILKKIACAKALGKPVDGHAPGLRGKDCQKYIGVGISTDHECTTMEEALEKLQYGMKILIREGSAAKNFESLIGLLPQHYENLMFCSDDKHPNELVSGHINQLCARATAMGMDLFKVLQVACVNPVSHYGMNVGQLREGDPADFIRVEDLNDFRVMQTYIDGEMVMDRGRSIIASVPEEHLNNFGIKPKKPTDFYVPDRQGKIRVIVATDGALSTQEIFAKTGTIDGGLCSDPDRDLLKITVVNRYREAPPAIGFVKNFGLRYGAIASCVSHDSHNIISVGTSDEMLCKAVNLIIQNKGGICAVDEDNQNELKLEVGGLMSGADAWQTARSYESLDAIAKKMGATLSAPFMTLSFMALLVIPDLKLSDMGLFSSKLFNFVPLQDPDYV